MSYSAENNRHGYRGNTWGMDSGKGLASHCMALDGMGYFGPVSHTSIVLFAAILEFYSPCRSLPACSTLSSRTQARLEI